MKRCAFALVIAAGLPLAVAVWAQAPAPAPASAPADSATAVAPVAAAAAPAPPAAPASAGKPSRVYYGGGVGFGFWNDYLRLSAEPLVAYKLTPKLSLGVKARYEFIHDSRGVVDYDSHNYGGSVFTRYRILPVAYAHAEYAYMSYDYPLGRQEVPFLLLGGGISKPLSPKTWLTAEVLFDVLQDDNSPYESGDPIVTVGVGVGF